MNANVPLIYALINPEARVLCIASRYESTRLWSLAIQKTLEAVGQKPRRVMRDRITLPNGSEILFKVRAESLRGMLPSFIALHEYPGAWLSPDVLDFVSQRRALGTRCLVIDSRGL